MEAFRVYVVGEGENMPEPQGYLKYLKNKGFVDLTGYEGEVSNQEFSNILKQDLSEVFNVNKKGNVICLEVGEHIPKQYKDVFLDKLLYNTQKKEGEYAKFHLYRNSNVTFFTRQESAQFT